MPAAVAADWKIAMADYLKGKKHEQAVYIKHELVDAKNVDKKLPPAKK